MTTNCATCYQPPSLLQVDFNFKETISYVQTLIGATVQIVEHVLLVMKDVVIQHSMKMKVVLLAIPTVKLVQLLQPIVCLVQHFLFVLQVKMKSNLLWICMMQQMVILGMWIPIGMLVILASTIGLVSLVMILIQQFLKLNWGTTILLVLFLIWSCQISPDCLYFFLFVQQLFSLFDFVFFQGTSLQQPEWTNSKLDKHAESCPHVCIRFVLFIFCVLTIIAFVFIPGIFMATSWVDQFQTGEICRTCSPCWYL